MFCVAKKQQKGTHASFPAVVLDYQDPSDDCYYEQPPGVRFCSHAASYQRLGMLPQVVLVHYPESLGPVVIRGALSWGRDGYVMHSYDYTSWSLDFKVCLPQNKQTKRLAERKGLPIDAPVLSKHNESPLMKIERSIVGAFYSSGSVDGEKLSRQWIAALTLLHNISMARTLHCLRFKEKKIEKHTLEENIHMNEFVVWWPPTKPSSLQSFIRQLWVTRRMSGPAQNALQVLNPFHAGFYRCEVSDHRLFVDDESNVPYDYTQRQNSNAPFSPNTARGKVIVQATVWLGLIFSPDDSSYLRAVSQEEKSIGLFLLPRSLTALAEHIGVERSENVEFSYELWKQHIGTQVCDKNVLQKLECDALENVRSLLKLGLKDLEELDGDGK